MVRHSIVRLPALTCAIVASMLSSSTQRVRAQSADTDRRAGVLILDFNVSALKNAADWAPIGKGIPQLLRTELAANPDLRIVDRENLDHALTELRLTRAALIDPATAARVGKFVGARYFVAGGITIDFKNNLRLDVHATKVETMVQDYAQKLQGKGDDVLDLIARLGSEMSKQFDPTPYDAPVRPASDTAHPTKEGLRLAMLLGSAIDLRDRNDVEGAKALVRQALALAPDNRGAKDMLAGLDRAP